VSDTDGIGAVTARAVSLYALGHHERAIHTLQAVMAARVDARSAAFVLAEKLLEDPNPPIAWEIIGLPVARHRRAVPVAGAFVSMARSHNYGGLYQLWDQLPAPVAGDVLAVLLAMAGAAACHPEWN
jgi:hypothetical protein